MVSEFEQRLIGAARLQMALDLQQQFARLDEEAQADVALTLLACAARLPPVFEREHLALLRESVDSLIIELGDGGAADSRGDASR